MYEERERGRDADFFVRTILYTHRDREGGGRREITRLIFSRHFMPNQPRWSYQGEARHQIMQESLRET